jgi:hypothetical protein
VQRLKHAELADISNLDATIGCARRTIIAGLDSLGNRLWHSDASFRECPARCRCCSRMSCRRPAARRSSPICAPPYDALDAPMQARIEA